MLFFNEGQLANNWHLAFFPLIRTKLDRLYFPRCVSTDLMIMTELGKFRIQSGGGCYSLLNDCVVYARLEAPASVRRAAIVSLSGLLCALCSSETASQ